MRVFRGEVRRACVLEARGDTGTATAVSKSARLAVNHALIDRHGLMRTFRHMDLWCGVLDRAEAMIREEFRTE